MVVGWCYCCGIVGTRTYCEKQKNGDEATFTGDVYIGIPVSQQVVTQPSIQIVLLAISKNEKWSWRASFWVFMSYLCC